MISDLPVYLVDGKYPDPHEILQRVRDARTPRQRDNLITAIRSSGLSSHPLLQHLFVES